MTDPRIEAAARALCIAHRNDPDDLVWITTEPGVQEPYGPRWVTCYHEAKQALDAADAAAWRPMSDAPKDGTVINVLLPVGISKSDQDFYCYPGSRVSFGWAWENQKFRPWTGLNLPVFIEPTHWQPLPAPPASSAELGGVDG